MNVSRLTFELMLIILFFPGGCCLTSSNEAVGCYGGSRQTGDGGDQRSHQDDRNRQSCFTKTLQIHYDVMR